MLWLEACSIGSSLGTLFMGIGKATVARIRNTAVGFGQHPTTQA